MPSPIEQILTRDTAPSMDSGRKFYVYPPLLNYKAIRATLPAQRTPEQLIKIAGGQEATLASYTTQAGIPYVVAQNAHGFVLPKPMRFNSKLTDLSTFFYDLERITEIQPGQEEMNKLFISGFADTTPFDTKRAGYTFRPFHNSFTVVPNDQGGAPLVHSSVERTIAQNHRAATIRVTMGLNQADFSPAFCQIQYWLHNKGTNINFSWLDNNNDWDFDLTPKNVANLNGPIPHGYFMFAREGSAFSSWGFLGKPTHYDGRISGFEPLGAYCLGRENHGRGAGIISVQKSSEINEETTSRLTMNGASYRTAWGDLPQIRIQDLLKKMVNIVRMPLDRHTTDLFDLDFQYK
ncbi:hypothetical protein HYV86_05380 [Candidatus Woesearchaeota archaeon]|nr:hypothetical protein [Candidatus Woesearchaeota archaeon]